MSSADALRRLRASAGRALDSATPTPRMDGWHRDVFDAPAASTTAAQAGGAVAPRADEDLPRCLLLTPALDAGGLDVFVADLTRHLRSSRFPVEVVHTVSSSTGPPGRRIADRLRAEGVTVHELDDGGLRRLLEDHRFEVVSAHGAPQWALDAAAEAGVPVVETLHGPFGMFAGEEETLRARAARVQHFVAVSAGTAERFRRLCPDHPPDRITVIPNGAKTPPASDLPRAEVRSRLGLDRDFLFVSLARHCLQKNTFALVSSFTEVADLHHEAHLVIAGRPDDKRYSRRLLALRASSPHADRIHLLDDVPRPARLLTAADAFVLDSYFEGWSLASTEAALAGVPLVLSDVSGARELVGPVSEANGHLVANPLLEDERFDWRAMSQQRYAPQRNRADLVAAMSSVVEAREEWADGREARSRRARSAFALETCLRAHGDLLVSAPRRKDLHG